jgi:hypothetical protein
MREYQVRICERLGVKFPGPTRQTRHFDPVPLTSDLPQQADISAWVGSSQGCHFGLARLSENKPVARSHRRGFSDPRPQAKRSRRGALFFLHFTLSRLQQTGDTWTAIRHRSRLCPLRARLGSLCAKPRQRTGQDRRDRLVDDRGGSAFTLIKKWSKRIRDGSTSGGQRTACRSALVSQRRNPATRVSQFHAHDLSRSASLICLFDELPVRPRPRTRADGRLRRGCSDTAK